MLQPQVLTVRSPVITFTSRGLNSTVSVLISPQKAAEEAHYNLLCSLTLSRDSSPGPNLFS